MRTGGGPDRDPPLRADVLHESARTRVTRLHFAGGTVIRKEPLGDDAPRRLGHELAILERLRGLAGVAQVARVAQASRYPGSIVMDDVGGTSLAALSAPMHVDDLIELAVQLAHVIAGMHRRGVMHRDVNPANIVISQDGSPSVVDFALATSLAEVRPEFTHHTQIVGTLAYLAPEQTGRTGRPVDQRADLYAFGATLYELATGAPPFGSGDPLRLVRDQLARVPVPPAELNPAVPGPLSSILMHLLEKEPDNRYQTAEGVVYDLERARHTQGRSAAVELKVGERDLPIRLQPPSQLVGREDELATLETAFDEALEGKCRGVLVHGTAGVGKTALVDELRSVVTGKDGWFVAGKFDQYRRDLEFAAVNQAFRALGRLLLAEPEDELTEVRARITATVGANLGLLAAAVPEFAALLAVPPDPGDLLTAHVRAQRTGVAVLRAVASRKRPVLLFVDDLQWAGSTPIGFVDQVLSDEPIEGLLLVGAYRGSDVDTGHPLAAPLGRWRAQAGVRHVRLDNLPVPGLITMVAEMLHVGLGAAAGLVEQINPFTSGNPYETVELLNGLRQLGALAASANGWRWDNATVRAHLGQSDVTRLLSTRVDAIPPTSRQVVEAMACLGGRAGPSVLQTAIGTPADVMEQMLAPALDEGLLVVEPGAHEALRFRHDHIREAILHGLDPQRRRTLHLDMARRLAGPPELFAVAAEQYLPVVDAVDDVAERRQVVGLLRRAAVQARVTGNYALANVLLAAALRLIEPGQTDLLVEVRTGRHAALFSIGRLEEADEEYESIARLSATALQRADATSVQVRSLTHRNRLAEALSLGLDSLLELGIMVPVVDRLSIELERQFDFLYRWLDQTTPPDDPTPAELTDPTLLAATRLSLAVLPVAYFLADLSMYAWLSLEAVRIWLEHGPGRTLIGPACHVAHAAAELRGDYVAAYEALQRIVTLGEARGYQPEVAQAHFMAAVLSWWYEPIDDVARTAQRALDGMIAGGDLATAGYTYYMRVYYLLDCAPTLDSCLAEVSAGLVFARRTGGEQTGQLLGGYQWLAGVMRGESSAAAGEVAALDTSVYNPLGRFVARITRAIAAAIFGDQGELARHTEAAMSLLPFAAGQYPGAVARVLRALALATQARAVHGDGRDDLLSELDEVLRWLAGCATDAPQNFLHLLRLVEAERAWAVGDFRAAALAFDAACREVARHQRPWHRALITERAARFALGNGLEHTGFDLLAQARQQYLAWGATAKVDQLDSAYASLQPEHDAFVEHGDRPGNRGVGRGAVTSGTLDLLGILSASQALSSATSIERLNSRVVEVLSAMTGATGVHLVLCTEDRHDWLLPTPAGDTTSISGVGHEHELPMSVLRYLQRTGDLLVVDDATHDDRFARDPYFTDLACCSLLAVPILSRGTLRAALLLENRLLRGAFTTDRLDPITLIAGQLAVSLDNAQLYAELRESRARIVAAADDTRRRIERDLHDGAQQRLVSMALRLRAAQATLPIDSDKLGAQLDSVIGEATAALDELRELARGIHPAILAEGGLGPALETLARRSAVPTELHCGIKQRLPEQVEIAAYYVVAEALTNTAKHAEASMVQIQVDTIERDTTEMLRIEIRDDGRGGADSARGTGLLGLKDRVEALGGHIHFDSPPEVGTTLRLELPLTDADGGP